MQVLRLDPYCCSQLRACNSLCCYTDMCDPTGVIFWQFGFNPYVSNSIFGKCRHCQAIQISASDSVFQNVIAPAALQASRLSKSLPRVTNCSSGENSS